MGTQHGSAECGSSSVTAADVTAWKVEASYAADVRAFAVEFPTPAVLRMVELAEAGRIEWADAYVLACRAVSVALREDVAGVAR